MVEFRGEGPNSGGGVERNDPGRTPLVRRRALQFGDEATFKRALGLLIELGNTGPIEFNPLGDNDVLLPQWSYRRLEPLLRRHKLPYEELEVVPISDLSPEEQARLRGLIWRRDIKP